jgi:hypothetical protein
MKMEELINKCGEVVAKWQEREPTLETVKDFAEVFGMEVGWWVRPVKQVAPIEPVDPEPQYELFNELSVEDKYAMKSWRSNNGL